MSYSSTLIIVDPTGDAVMIRPFVKNTDVSITFDMTNLASQVDGDCKLLVKIIVEYLRTYGGECTIICLVVKCADVFGRRNVKLDVNTLQVCEVVASCLADKHGYAVNIFEAELDQLQVRRNREEYNKACRAMDPFVLLLKERDDILTIAISSSLQGKVVSGDLYRSLQPYFNGSLMQLDMPALLGSFAVRHYVRQPKSHRQFMGVCEYELFNNSLTGFDLITVDNMEMVSVMLDKQCPIPTTDTAHNTRSEFLRLRADVACG